MVLIAHENAGSDRFTHTYRRLWPQSPAGTGRQTRWETRGRRRGWGRSRAPPGDCRGPCGNREEASRAGTSGSAGTHTQVSAFEVWQKRRTIRTWNFLFGSWCLSISASHLSNKSLLGAYWMRGLAGCRPRTVMLGLWPLSFFLLSPCVLGWENLNFRLVETLHKFSYKYTFLAKLKPRGISNTMPASLLGVKGTLEMTL